MALSAMAQETVSALRRQIARLEGTLPERLAAPAAAGSQEPLLATGAHAFDDALGGGLSMAALTEILGVQSRDAGAVAGLVLALAGRLLKKTGAAAPLLWVGTAEIFRESGYPYLPGLLDRFGIAAADLLIAEAPKLADALWIAEEATGLKALTAVLLEVPGNPARLDLTATRRLHRRAQAAGRPVFLLRHAGRAEPTAAPVRLIVAPAPASPRLLLGGSLPGSIGPPGFEIRIDKSRTAPPRQFTLEWNADDHAFADRPQQALWPQDHGAVVSLSRHRAHPAPAAGSVVAFTSATGDTPAAGRQPSRQQQPAHRGARRTG